MSGYLIDKNNLDLIKGISETDYHFDVEEISGENAIRIVDPTNAVPLYAVGILTGQLKTVVFSVPIGKTLENVAIDRATSFTGTIHFVDGTTLSAGLNAAGVDVPVGYIEADKANDNTVTMIISYPSAGSGVYPTSAPLGSPVTVRITDLSLHVDE